MGGVTYLEAKEAATFGKGDKEMVNPQIEVVVGGSTIHNSKSFLAEVSQLGSQPQSFEIA